MARTYGLNSGNENMLLKYINRKSFKCQEMLEGCTSRIWPGAINIESSNIAFGKFTMARRPFSSMIFGNSFTNWINCRIFMKQCKLFWMLTNKLSQPFGNRKVLLQGNGRGGNHHRGSPTPYFIESSSPPQWTIQMHNSNSWDSRHS